MHVFVCMCVSVCVCVLESFLELFHISPRILLEQSLRSALLCFSSAAAKTVSTFLESELPDEMFVFKLRCFSGVLTFSLKDATRAAAVTLGLS